jgi:hypothetical protein
MRPPVLAAALVLAGCVVYERRPYAEPPSPAEATQQVISEQRAVEVAFRLCQDRRIYVDRVERVHLDPAGRWHVLLAGYVDRAQMLLDGRDGKLLKGRFRQVEPPATAAPPAPAKVPPQDDLD